MEDRPDGVQELVAMGFSEDVASLACAELPNATLEDKINLIFSLCEQDRDQPEQEELKMVLVVRSDLNMSSGKVAAQCVHVLHACRQ